MNIDDEDAKSAGEGNAEVLKDESIPMSSGQSPLNFHNVSGHHVPHLKLPIHHVSPTKP